MERYKIIYNKKITKMIYNRRLSNIIGSIISLVLGIILAGIYIGLYDILNNNNQYGISVVLIIFSVFFIIIGILFGVAEIIYIVAKKINDLKSEAPKLYQIDGAVYLGTPP